MQRLKPSLLAGIEYGKDFRGDEALSCRIF
jgi:hypothetical protein